MSFASFNFILSLPLFILSFWLVPRRLQKPWLLVLSLVVYLAAGLGDFLLLFGAVSLNWLVPRCWDRPRLTTPLMVAGNLAFLAYFKYRLFLAGLVATARPATLIIPLGISFYVFQLISYQVEIRRGQLGSRQPFLNFFLYIFFFPHHQAGPIMRPHAFLHAFTRPRTFFTSRLVTGMVLLLWGLFKKVWIADLVAPQVDQAFRLFHFSGGAEGNLVQLGVLFGIQVYGDFSGYSDMAVGIGRMFGFKFDRNFHQPYVAFGPSEFWRRWHVTLSQWLRDFVYIPLGGNRRGTALACVNLLATMLIGGLWHGAGWNFLVWGGLHGTLLILDRLLPAPAGSWHRWLRYGAFQLMVMLTWVPFREPDLRAIGHALGRQSAWLGARTDQALKLLVLILLFSWLERAMERHFVRLTRWLVAMPLWRFACAYGVLMFFVMVGAGHATTFIYQRF